MPRDSAVTDRGRARRGRFPTTEARDDQGNYYNRRHRSEDREKNLPHKPERRITTQPARVSQPRCDVVRLTGPHDTAVKCPELRIKRCALRRQRFTARHWIRHQAQPFTAIIPVSRSPVVRRAYRWGITSAHFHQIAKITKITR